MNNIGRLGDLWPFRRPLKQLSLTGPSEQASGSQWRSNQNWWMWVGFNLAVLNWLEGRLCFEVENSISFRRSDPTSPGKPSHTHFFPNITTPPIQKPIVKAENSKYLFFFSFFFLFCLSTTVWEILSLSWPSGQQCGILTNFKGLPSLWSSQIRQLAVKGSQTEEKNWAKRRWKEESEPPSGLTTNSFSSHTGKRMLRATQLTVPDVDSYLFSP